MSAKVVARLVTIGAVFVAVAGALAAFAHATRSIDAIARAPTIEDAFYALTVARNAAFGRGLATGGATTFAPTDGFQPLWVIALTPIFWLFRSDTLAALRAVSALSSVLFVAIAIVVGHRAVGRARRLEVDPRTSGAIAIALVLGSFSTFAQTLVGLVTALHVLTIALAVEAIGAGATWTVRALILAIACWARLDAALFAVAYSIVAIDARRRTGKLDRSAIAASLVAIASLGPWMIRSVRLHGDWMPTSGGAESIRVYLFENVRGAALAIDRWLMPTLFRPGAGARWTQLLDVAIAIGALIAFVRGRRMQPSSPARSQLDDGDRTLALYVAMLTVIYVTRFGAPYFMARFLAPTLLLTVPIAATWLARRPPAALAILAATIVLDGGWYARSLADDPAGHPNRNYTEQVHT
ncbi:MAG: hypothetical protein ACHREM_27200, partial [Polyangiales bacterium]